MGSWVGFTGRLRRHGRAMDKTTQGYCETAADRIDDLEEKLRTAEYERDVAKESVRKINR